MSIRTKLPSICVMKLHGIFKKIHVTFFKEAEKYGERHIGHSLRSWPMLLSCHLYYLQETPNFLSFHTITFSALTIFKIRLQIRIQDKILIWKHVSHNFWQKKFKIFMFSRHKIFNFQNFENPISDSDLAWNFDVTTCIIWLLTENFKIFKFSCHNFFSHHNF